jgi:3-dehydroquinate synthetase
MPIEFPARWRLTASRPLEYQITYAPNLFDLENLSLLEPNSSSRRLVFVDSKVYANFSQMINKYFETNAPGSVVISVEANELLKTLDHSLVLIKHMEDFGLLRRSEPVIAIGGGSLLDSVGFACSIYRRGVPYIRVPTTLLSIVDVSVAIKTGVNHLGRRNRLGTYYPPSAVFLYRKFIETQGDREICNGLGEILKLAIIEDLSLFLLLEGNSALLRKEKFQYGAIPVKVINRAITVMMNNLQNNLWEDNLMRAVDFGHSFSPLIEQDSLPELLHGEAVALDCLFSSCLSFNRGLLDEVELTRIFRVTRDLGLPTTHEGFLDSQQLMRSLMDTIKHRNGNQNLPVPLGIGSHQFLNDIQEDEIIKATKTLEDLNRREALSAEL